MTEIPTFYRIFFLYIDPLVCLSSIYIFFFDHATYLASGVPHSIPVHSMDPLTQYLLAALGSYSLCIFGIQILLLRQFPDIKIWRIVMFSILMTDLGLLYGVYAVDPKGFLDIGGWTSGDWTNNGILCTIIGIRSCFLLANLD